MIRTTPKLILETNITGDSTDADWTRNQSGIRCFCLEVILIWTDLERIHSLRRTSGNGPRTASGLCLTAAEAFPAIGAAWLLAHRLGWMPWGFDPLIVLLTAAHFHHAGYTLPLMAGLLANDRPTAFTRRSCTAILTGVPLVAIGITSTHFGIARWVEPIAVTVLVLGALGVAVSQLRLGIVSTPHSSRPAQFAFLISGTSLFIAMLLALSFGLRTLLPQFALGMPQMWAIHGTLNTFGFGLCGLLAWRAQSADQLASPEAPD